MPDLLTLVNGLPGSGKTTLATALAPALNAALLSKDTVKDALVPVVPAAAAPWTLGAASMEAIWTVASGTPGDVVVESWFFASRDSGHVAAGLARVRPTAVVEVWCDVPADLAASRFLARSRPDWYADQERFDGDWADWADRAEPLDVGPVVRVDTSRAVDVARVADLVRLAAVHSAGLSRS
ncbi:conserved hypothetical protein [Beutenbergia cavernae DSM 12333]|uniref:Kinase n=1 Tax=Beutenbergia cavernae (strain ATCC BAA-8 / DSM 12333 / CCUG 43141 / JCM 11478 / NBRC 16432 / NCIMB 13614 / HKI 0122) TaxID=471853 RepID=C5C1B1_BEUC1|nr:AAA family ATPase [Beutenbergia cavernae]ACQ81521.1 conserved hypothetical protein [Beutenbergia cavernae DSM 12333]